MLWAGAIVCQHQGFGLVVLPDFTVFLSFSRLICAILDLCDKSCVHPGEESAGQRGTQPGSAEPWYGVLTWNSAMLGEDRMAAQGTN